MATPSFIGTIQDIAIPSAQSDPAGISVTVPSGAEMAIVMGQYYQGADALQSVTLGGVSSSEFIDSYADNASPNGSFAAMFLAPASGSKDVVFDWATAPNANDGPCACIFFLENTDETSLRDLAAVGTTSTTPISFTVTSQTTDMVYAFDARADGAATPGEMGGTWTSEFTGNGNGSYYRLSSSPGQTTTTTINAQDENYSAAVAVVVKESAGGSILPLINAYYG